MMPSNIFRYMRRFLHVSANKKDRISYSNTLALEAAANSDKMCVLVSKSDDIVRNLAFEDWIYENANFHDHKYVFFWRNKPAVVCGWHQNPWVECNVPRMSQLGIPLVRRKSGGGTVYHDEGNVNCSVICHKRHYDKRNNLNIVVSAIQDRWPQIDLSVNERSDIILDGLYKVSGSASKLSGFRTYHHFTLLLKADLLTINELLVHNTHGVCSQATHSVRSKVAGLADVSPDVTYNAVVTVLTSAFASSPNTQTSPVMEIYPDETSYPGLESKMSAILDWSTVFGRTPKFTVTRTFVCDQFGDLAVKAVLCRGCFSEVVLDSSMADPGVNAYLSQASLYLINKPLRLSVIHDCFEDNHLEENINFVRWFKDRILETFDFI